MINVLPKTIKDNRRFGRLNRLIIRQLFGLTLIGVFAVGFMLSGLRLVENDEKLITDSIAVRQLEYAELKTYEEQAVALNADVRSIQKLFDREVRFSTLLVDIAASIPIGARLTSLSLTGGSEEPLQITAIVNSQEDAAVLRKTLDDSDAFEAADLLNITPGETSDSGVALNYNVTLTASLAQKDAKKAEDS